MFVIQKLIMADQKPYVAPHALRGLTTLQLLELAGIVTDNAGYSQNLAARQQNVYWIADHLRGALGIPLPEKMRGKFKKVLAPKANKQGHYKDGASPWFADGSKATGALRAVSTEGQQIEAARGVIYDYVAARMGWLAQVQYYPPNTAGKTKNQIAAGQVDASAASVIDEALTTSYSWGSAKEGKTAAQRFQALADVWALTDRNQEPEDVAREGGIGRRPANQANADKNAAESNGFLAKNVKKVLVSLSSNARTRGVLSAQQTQARAAAANYIRQLAGVQGGVNVTQAKQAVDQRLADANIVHSAWTQVDRSLAAMGGIWAALGKTEIKGLLSGQAIFAPVNPETGSKEFFYVAGAQASSDPVNNAAGYVRYVYDTLNARYTADGAAGDKRSAAAQKAASSRPAYVHPGVSGTDHPIFKSLNWNNAKNVGKFIRRGLQGGFTIEALKLGAQQLQVPVDAGAVLHASVAQAIADAVVRIYARQLDSNTATADQVKAVAAALKLRLPKAATGTDANSIQMGRQAIIQHLDALYGNLTGNCQDLSKSALKSVARAASVSESKVPNKEALCRQLGQPGAASAAVSSGRRERSKAYVERPKKTKSGKTKSQQTGVLQQLLNIGAGGQVAQAGPGGRPASRPQSPVRPASPRLPAATAPGALGGLPQPTLSGNRPASPRLPSVLGGSQSPRGLPAPTIGGGLPPASNAPGNGLEDLFPGM